MNNKQQDVWLKAAVIGSIWASFEIIFGSFFHSLRLPFAGTFLTFTSIVLLITFSYKWDDKNLFLKAGIIAALMRSLMPTSVILGPLIGIITEAILFQLAISFLGRNFFSYSLAGILAMFSAILHKVVSIILIYGWDIVEILENLYYVLLRITRIDLPVRKLLLLLIVVYVVFGIIAAIIGMFSGKQLNKDNFSSFLPVSNEWNPVKDLFHIEDFRYKSEYIYFHLTALIVLLMSLEFYPIFYVIFPMLLYLWFVFKRYGKSLRRLAKPLFWFQLVIIVLMAVWLWQDKIEGLLIGLKMILRAVLVVSVFTAISVELKNPLVKALLYKRGYSQLYATLALATSAVPYILKNISNDKKTLFNPMKVLKKAIGLSDVLLEEFTAKLENMSKIIIITGNVRSGKTTFLKKIINALQEQKTLNIAGIIASGIDKNGERYGFEIEELSTGQKFLLSTKKAVKGKEKIGSFYFNNQVFEQITRSIVEKLPQTDLLIIDEVGYLELKGKGWFGLIDKAIQQNKPMILVVRKRILDNILSLWRDYHIETFDIVNSNPEEIILKFKKQS